MFKSILKYLLRNSPFIIALAGTVKYAMDCKTAYDQELERNESTIPVPQETVDAIVRGEAELLVSSKNGKIKLELLHSDKSK